MNNRRFSAFVVTVLSILVIATICWSATKSLEKSNISEADYKAACKQISVSELTKNADRKKGELVKVTGQILVFEESGGNGVITRIIVSVKDDTNTLPSGKLPVYVRYHGKTDSFINDTVTIYGKVYGNDVYQSPQIQKKTLPRLDAKYITK